MNEFCRRRHDMTWRDMTHLYMTWHIYTWRGVTWHIYTWHIYKFRTVDTSYNLGAHSCLRLYVCVSACVRKRMKEPQLNGFFLQERKIEKSNIIQTRKCCSRILCIKSEREPRCIDWGRDTSLFHKFALHRKKNKKIYTLSDTQIRINIRTHDTRV